jgi:mono/diheme cytochrome c family protein
LGAWTHDGKRLPPFLTVDVTVGQGLLCKAGLRVIRRLASADDTTKSRQLGRIVAPIVCLLLLGGCSMKEEIKRIEAVKQAQQANEASRSDNLTGEQVFIRSCNTCHPSGKKGFGPSLIAMDDHFPTDDKLKALIRDGKGAMPGQPPATLNDRELSNLVDYLRRLNTDLKADQK